MEPQIRFCTSADGTRIAYATMGEGPPLVAVAGWLATMDLTSKVPEGAAFRDALAQDRLTVSIDRRGQGASQRQVKDLSLRAHVADLSAVVDHLQLERFDLFGVADGAVVSVAYAAQNPGRVSRLVLWSVFSCGEDFGAPEATRVLADLIRKNWGVARRALANLIFPSARPEMVRLYSHLLREAVASEVAAQYMEYSTSADLNVRPLLPQVQAPTLVLHRRRDRVIPFGAGRAAAALIPDARFVALEGDADYPYPDHQQIADLIRQFLNEGRSPAAPSAPVPSGLVTILFTDMESSTALTDRLGDAKAQELRRAHDSIVREALKAQGGSETKHTGDGIMASFPSASRAIECAVAVQRAIAEGETPLRVRIGLNAGEPVAEDADLFGTAVNLAKRICDQAEPGQILVSDVVQQLAAGKGFTFADKGEATLKGFEKPARLHEVRWREA